MDLIQCLLIGDILPVYPADDGLVLHEPLRRDMAKRNLARRVRAEGIIGERLATVAVWATFQGGFPSR
jgi:hypothetical protein